MLLLLLAALSMGMSNFAGAIAIGVSGVERRTRLRVGVVFGLFEGGMPLVGLAIGHSIVHVVGGSSRWIAAGLLVATGGHALIEAVRERNEAGSSSADTGMRRLLITGFALSIDNLVVGFALGAYKVNILLAVVLIAAVSVTLSLIGLELGARIGERAGSRGEMFGGIVLIVVGVVVATGAL